MNTPQSDTPISNKEELRQYKDSYGNPCDLLRLVKNEPGWAVNQIRHRDKLERELAAANERVKKLEVAADRLNLLLCCEFGYCDTEEWNTSSIAQRCKMVEEASGELDKLMRRAKP